jgi:hypothetical protein
MAPPQAIATLRHGLYDVNERATALSLSPSTLPNKVIVYFLAATYFHKKDVGRGLYSSAEGSLQHLVPQAFLRYTNNGGI